MMMTETDDETINGELMTDGGEREGGVSLSELEPGDEIEVEYSSVHGDVGDEQILTGSITRIEPTKEYDNAGWSNVAAYIIPDGEDVDVYEEPRRVLINYKHSHTELQNKNGLLWNRLNSGGDPIIRRVGDSGDDQELVTDGGEDEPAVFLAGVDRNAWLNLTVDTEDGEVQIRAFVVDNYSERAGSDQWGRVPGSVALSLETDDETFERLELPAEVINVDAREPRRGEFTELILTVWDPVRGEDGEWKDEYSVVGTVTAASVDEGDEDDD